MRFFRRGETLNERLLREAGLDRSEAELDAEAARPPPPLDPVLTFRQQFDTGAGALAGAGLPPRARRWDAVVTAEAPDVDGNEVDFVALPDGSLLVEEEEGVAALDPFAQAVEGELPPPYRVHAVRQTERLWAVSALRIEVARFEADGDVIELTQTNDGRALRVDGMPAFGSIPALERLGEAAAGPAYAVHAERLDADLWEVRVAPL
ncbi:MAG: hypothetical protein E6G19_01775 [Actinobacteria bacterium]|nr:MAG: hypothetical protein E6G19_01775 [Actinomycetota bacterium]